MRTHTDSRHLAGCVVDAIRRAEVVRDPFPHLIADDVLPAAVFERLLDDLPPVERLVTMASLGWRSIAQYDRHRTALLHEIEGCRDPDVWATTDQALLDDQVEMALREVFDPWFDRPVDAPPTKEVRLDCAVGGGHLAPHTDSPVILMKALIYLTPQVCDRRLDTILYEPRDPAARAARLGPTGDFTPGEYQHESLEDHREAGRVAYRPNRLFAFPRSRDSLHGLAPIPPALAPRYLLVTHYKLVRS